ncbi:GmrSD restriction endonuclease domain-containing protein [Actinobacillus equuli]|uniref:Uncharacterized conserved protein n=1 Tax=Actinobacillus equuli TaxID=718 RepID=A0AAX3FNR9_ACTEU|nr:DUF262 domain-containing protein [Actinobacillus equuli]AIZ78364.1 hypothetical protein ACEE_00905 [Actinobacillus equuli subsp. equuli]WGE44635.1 DUF262 domain-containing protein [Actinobacillus equuli subsp. equuli]WGE46800.1 DUF262 domain-containing protein [Actinobacillus equuli subsp. haemolyticus]WGE65555.1 DUF262 domain-containing protein [Actinobacillus equuli subsp. equuli]WGE79552.1 DUF262 domain-containing protein [Actinobacillus equuli subsp. equuli]
MDETNWVEEIDDEQSLPILNNRQIFTDLSDREIKSLKDKKDKGRLLLQPEFQRYYVWDAKQASKLIESALLDVPLPVIYLSEDKDGKECVIDGQQRLTSFFSFISGSFPNGNEFTLKGLNVLTELNGKTFADLSEEQQDKVESYSIRVIKFKKESDENLKFEIFERLNTGSVQLNDQELRNCIYRGKFNQALKEMADYPDFRDITGFKQPHNRMADIELVLRFCAFYKQTYLKYTPSMKNFLNLTARNNTHLVDEEIQELKDKFKQACSLSKSVFSDKAFKRFTGGISTEKYSGDWDSQALNRSLYDIVMWVFADLDKNKVMRHSDEIREALIDLMASDREFIESITISTSSKKAIRRRFKVWHDTVSKIVESDSQEKEPRCFSLALKEEMMEKDPTCNICNNRIHHIDDAAIDHIQQYWQGGRTIPENARLTHRYCNNARMRKE